MNSFDNSTLAIEAESIIRGTEALPNWTYKGYLIVGDQRHEVMKIVSMDEEADFAQDFADNISVELMIGAGTYVKNILPYRESLRMQIDEIPNGVFGNESGGEIVTRLYNVMLPDVEVPGMSGSTPEYNASAEALDLMSILRIKVELTDINVDLIRTMEFGTVIVAKRPREAIESTLTVLSEKITRDYGSKILGVDVVPTDNNQRIEQFIVSHGTRLVDFPDYIHNRLGLYNSGLGFFYRDRRFYVWPLYNYSRAANSERKISFIIAPQNRYPGVERTYRTTANQTVVLVTGGAKVIDTSEHFAQSEGAGIRMANASALLESHVSVSKNVATTKRSEGVTEMIGMARAGELNKVVTRPTSNNIYKETSAIAARRGNRMMVVWENANPTLIKPGLPVEVTIEKDGLPVVLGATILGVHTFTGSPSNSIKSSMHRKTCLVTLFVDRNTPEVMKYRDDINKDWYNEVAVEE